MHSSRFPRRGSVVTFVAATIAPLALTAQSPAGSAALSGPLAAAHDSSLIAWERGDFADALARWERVLQQPGGDQLVEAVALTTGELHPAIELAADGRALRWSPDGRTLAFTTGTGADQRTTVMDVSGAAPRQRLVVAGGSGVFSGDGATLYVIRVEETAALRAARAAVTRAPDAAAARRAGAEVTREAQRASRVIARTLASEREQVLTLPEGLVPSALAAMPAGRAGVLAAVVTPGEQRQNQLYLLGAGTARALTDGDGVKTGMVPVAGGVAYVAGAPARTFSGGATGVADQGARVVIRMDDGATRTIPGRGVAASRDGSAIAVVGSAEGRNTLQYLSLSGGGEPVTVLSTERAIANPALSPDGRAVAFQMMPREDWEVYVWRADQPEVARLTREVQHDLFPQFIADGRLLSVVGEARHRRSHLYDLETGERRRLFHNNLVRTVAPEYEWEVSPDGSRVAIVSERDGDTISPERGVYLTSFAQRVSLADLLARVRAQLAAERVLRAQGEAIYAPIADRVRATVADVSVDRIYRHAANLYRFDSKFIGMPGNLKAIDYLAATLRSYGYEPELQWFEPGPGQRTANVIARLRGTADPDLVYVISSHFDSVRDGPGADDNSSGTTALLEAARVLATRPQAATIEFAFFTGEEAGLLGSREYVRQAVASGKRIVGALNNDMIGYTNDQRLDNTIRYSNAGLRDLQHGAALLFTRLITYDAKYYKNTDAHAYYDAYGDIVAGIGSYPILANPHYHQTHDVLETINQALVAEVSRATVASIMLMASSPSRVAEPTMVRAGRGATVRWTPSVESGVVGYEVAVGTPADPFARIERSTSPEITLTTLPAGSVVHVRAIGPNGTRGWDWRRLDVR